MYRVLTGHVRVEKGNNSTKVGQGAVLNSLGTGHTFGEMSFLDGSLPCANCIAEEEEVQVLRAGRTRALRLPSRHLGGRGQTGERAPGPRSRGPCPMPQPSVAPPAPHAGPWGGRSEGSAPGGCGS